LLILADTAALAHSPAAGEDRHRLARIQCLWVELQAARKDPVRYEAIAERIRREADSFRKTRVRPRLMHWKDVSHRAAPRHVRVSVGRGRPGDRGGAGDHAAWSRGAGEACCTRARLQPRAWPPASL